MISIPYMPAIALALLLAAFFGGRSCGASAEREEWQQKEAARAAVVVKKDLATTENNVREIVRYVDRIKVVEKSVPRVVTKLVSLCDDGPRWRVQDTGELAPRSGADAPSGQLDQLGAELVKNRLNIEQCKALIAVARPQAHGRDAP